MFENLAVIRLAAAMAKHAGARQAVIAQNMANADTPGYAARDIAPFQVEPNPLSSAFVPRATRPSHLIGPSPQSGPRVIYREGAVADPNGNSVSVETEMIHAAETKREHDRALAIYRSSLTILRSAIGRR